MLTIPLNVKCTCCAHGWMMVTGEFTHCDSCGPQPGRPSRSESSPAPAPAT